MPDENQQREPTPYERFKANPVVRLESREVDLSDFPGVSIDMKKRLKKQYGIIFGAMSDDPEDEEKLVHFILHEACPAVRLEEVGVVDVITSSYIGRWIGERTATARDRPFLTRSTSSPTPTDGAATSSSDTARQNSSTSPSA